MGLWTQAILCNDWTVDENMNILVVSDDHGMSGFSEAFALAKEKCGTVDMVLHAGDTESHTDEYYKNICGCPVYIVRGNNDYNDRPLYQVVIAEDKRIFITHGHKYGVYYGLQNLLYAGLENDVDIIVYGHTHIPDYTKAGDVHIFNPGSLALPRRSRYGSFAIINIENGDIKVEHFTIM